MFVALSPRLPAGLTARGLYMDWPLWALRGALCAAFAAQVFLLPDLGFSWGVSAEALKERRWWTLITSMFIHAGLLHLAMNAFAASLGRPLLRRLGLSARGVSLFFLFYLACGLAGGLAFVALNPNGDLPAIGASGALFGLWGAVARLGPGDEPVKPLFSKDVRRHIWAATRQNLVFIAILFAVSLTNDGQGPKLAWEAHAGGFLAGLLLIAPVLRLGGPPTLAARTASTGRFTVQFGDETFAGEWTLRGDTMVVTTPTASISGRLGPDEPPNAAVERLLMEIYREGRPA